MSTKIDELKLDIEEVNNLLQRANRQRSKDVLNLEIRRLQMELEKLADENNSKPIKSVDTISDASHKCYEVKLNNYGWDQTSTTVKLYVTLKDVHQLSKEAVICNFTEKSFELRILGLDNKNYTLTINDLCEEIDINKSNAKIKTDMVVLSLAKKVAKHWSHVTGVEKRNKESKALAISSMEDMEDNDPNASVMNLMKKLYQGGDDEMKMIIAKSWTTCQEKRAAGSFDYS